MALPYPPEAVAGTAADPAEGSARSLYAQYAWIARLADEMDTEAELDLKRAMQLVLHARKFRQFYDELQALITAGTHTQAQVFDVVDGFFAMKKCRWARRQDMVADLAQLYADCQTIADWVETNIDYKGGFSVNRIISTDVMTDDPIKVAKPAAAGTRIAALRGRFGAKP